jgi:membrane-associated phospholipid phosphatase
MMLMGAGAFMAWVPRTIKAYHSLPRPPALLDPEQYTLIGDAYYGGAFPSGHSATIFFIVALIYFMYQRPGPRIIAFFVGILVGASRIACGIHWPTDVLAGAALGWVISALAYIVFSKWPRQIPPTAELVLHRLPVLAVAAGIPWYETAYEGTRLGFVVVCIAMISLWGWLNVISAKST